METSNDDIITVRIGEKNVKLLKELLIRALGDFGEVKVHQGKIDFCPRIRIDDEDEKDIEL